MLEFKKFLLGIFVVFIWRIGLHNLPHCYSTMKAWYVCFYYRIFIYLLVVAGFELMA
jgi:hypothetical protein